MKQLILTGMATEHAFMNGGGVEAYFLIFNYGEVRIPVPQETAEAVIKELYGTTPDEETPQEIPQEESIPPPQQASVWDDDDGVDQI